MLSVNDGLGQPDVSTQRIPIAELKSGDHVESFYMLQDVQIRNRKDGTSFATIVLRDATGKITGIMWDNFESLRNQTIKVNDVVQVTGDVQKFQNKLQMRVTRVSRVNESDVLLNDLLPSTPFPVEELKKEFRGYIAQIRDKDLKRLVQRIFDDPKRWDAFCQAPSAVSMHQGYLGGLLEHTVFVTRNALRIAENYPQVNRDLLVAGALLHDIGKIAEFEYERQIAYTDVGRLIGHIPIGHALIEVECSRIPNFPANKKILIQHMILSHHGHLEFGSPKRPKTLEAIILHHADLLDAQISNYLEIAGNLQKVGAKWEYSPMFERYIFGGTPDMLQTPPTLLETSSQSSELDHPVRPRSGNRAEEGLSKDDLLGLVEDPLEE